MLKLLFKSQSSKPAPNNVSRLCHSFLINRHHTRYKDCHVTKARNFSQSSLYLKFAFYSSQFLNLDSIHRNYSGRGSIYLRHEMVYPRIGIDRIVTNPQRGQTSNVLHKTSFPRGLTRVAAPL